MLISVIVPVYNAEAFLSECVESVIKQSYTKFELLLVDDGSNDKSGAICDRYAEKDNRIKVIHKENGGASSARNVGIHVSQGAYITFLDADDYWNDKDALFLVVQRLQKTEAEVLNYSYIKVFENNGKKIEQFHDIPPMNESIKNKIEQLEYLFHSNLYIASPCNKMISRSLFEQGLYFDEGRSSEDIEWCARMLVHAKSLDFLCINFYCYRQHDLSTTHTMNKKSCIDLMNNILLCVELGNKCKQEYKEFIYQYAAYQFATFFAVQALVGKLPNECMNKLNTIKWVLRFHGTNKKVKCICLLTKIFGLKGTCFIIRKTKRLWGM